MPEFCGLDANGLFSDAVRVVVFAGDVRRCSWTQRPVPQLASLCFRIIRVQSSSSHAASRLGSVERRLQARCCEFLSAGRGCYLLAWLHRSRSAIWDLC